MTIELGILLIILLVGLGVGLFLLWKEKQVNRTISPEEIRKVSKPAHEYLSSWIQFLTISQPQARTIQELLQKTIIGQPLLINGLLLSLFSGKHILIKSLPGMAKTLAIKNLAQILGLSFWRIQGTPDLLPSDLTGIQNREGETKKGPLFSNIVLFDEINRTTPKVQSACIQAMEEGQITIGTGSLELPSPFLVFATANPAWSKGVYDLPEAQLDRFGLSLELQYPENEEEIIRSGSTKIDSSTAKVQLDFEEIHKEIDKVEISDEMISLITNILQKTRNLPDLIEVGCSPRSGKDLVWITKTAAWLQGKTAVDKWDIESLCDSVLEHRIVWKRNKRTSLHQIIFS